MPLFNLIQLFFVIKILILLEVVKFHLLFCDAIVSINVEFLFYTVAYYPFCINSSIKFNLYFHFLFDAKTRFILIYVYHPPLYL